MKKYILMIALCITQSALSQIDPKNIDIVRDSFGVPHIFAPTDAEVAYGLAWAHSEDDFKTIQQGYLAGNNQLSKSIGNAGLGADFIAQFIDSEALYEEYYEKKISLEYKRVLEGYKEGINRYALTHPEEVLVENFFPITTKEMIRYAQLQLFISSKGDQWVKLIVNNSFKYEFKEEETPKGSNTFAFNSSKTEDGSTFLAINTHQPLDGPVSWYEAHLCSEEGTNILGALFAGSPNILIGVNENLAWAHTVNQPDKTDVFALEMHPKEKLKYKVDDSYLTLELKKAKLQVRVLGIPIQIKKKFYQSIYGPALKNKSGVYAVRTPALFEIRALEQWWRMNKATNFTEFYNALKMKALPGYNIGYADKNDTIFYISNGLIPKRAEGYNWSGVVPGNTTKTLWEETYDIEELPQVIQPKSGYVYNANHTPFRSSDEDDNPIQELFDASMGFETYDNNRSTRLKALIDQHNTVNYEEFKTIKYDHQYPIPYAFSWMNINHLDQLNSNNYPEIKLLIDRLQAWDRGAEANSLGAGAFAIFYNQLRPFYRSLPPPKIFPPSIIVQALRNTKEYMLKYFNTLDVRLGDYQKLVRGDKELPIFGLPDVITAMASIPYKEGKVKIVSGESYIELVRFTKEGPEIESVISYGSSDYPNSEHYNDQMKLYASFKTKKMTLNKEKIYVNAKKIYNPK
ncbi:MAG: penicillin acylase family protein [Flavobacteriaceae bacterium]|nr:penicillin acylase family protein [Flavobacteriaceae bacterium]MDG2503759.1 penicillin acylase family protein [Flavobacteriaceae bacterium]